MSGFLGIEVEYDSLLAGPRIANDYFMNWLIYLLF